MDNAVRRRANADIIARERLAGGISFDTWLLTLSDGRKLVFRSGEDCDSPGGRRIIAAQTFAREAFFYDELRDTLDGAAPCVIAIDGTRELYPRPFQLYEYIEGVPLEACFGGLSPDERRAVRNKAGLMLGRIHSRRIDPCHPYVRERGQWRDFVRRRLGERLAGLYGFGIITRDEAEAVLSRVGAMEYEGDALSFLHMDLRPCNLIYNGLRLGVIDAENCEWGDPYFELARLDINHMLDEDFVSGYFESTGQTEFRFPQMYGAYKLEALALVLGVILAGYVKAEGTLAAFPEEFKRIKTDMLSGG